MSTSTSAPAAFALALGFHEATNGTAAPAAPIPPCEDLQHAGVLYTAVDDVS